MCRGIWRKRLDRHGVARKFEAQGHWPQVQYAFDVRRLLHRLAWIWGYCRGCLPRPKGVFPHKPTPENFAYEAWIRDANRTRTSSQTRSAARRVRARRDYRPAFLSRADGSAVLTPVDSSSSGQLLAGLARGPAAAVRDIEKRTHVRRSIPSPSSSPLFRSVNALARLKTAAGLAARHTRRLDDARDRACGRATAPPLTARGTEASPRSLRPWGPRPTRRRATTRRPFLTLAAEAADAPARRNSWKQHVSTRRGP